MHTRIRIQTDYDEQSHQNLKSIWGEGADAGAINDEFKVSGNFTLFDRVLLLLVLRFIIRAKVHEWFLSVAKDEGHSCVVCSFVYVCAFTCACMRRYVRSLAHFQVRIHLPPYGHRIFSLSAEEQQPPPADDAAPGMLGY